MTAQEIPGPRMLQIHRADQPDVVTEVWIYPASDHPATTRALAVARADLATRTFALTEAEAEIARLAAAGRAAERRCELLAARVARLERARRVPPLAVALATVLVACERLAGVWR